MSKKKNLRLKKSAKIAIAALSTGLAVTGAVIVVNQMMKFSTPPGVSSTTADVPVENYATWNENDESLFSSTTSEVIRKKYEEKETFVILVADENDVYCEELVPILNDIAHSYEFETIEYIDRTDSDAIYEIGFIAVSNSNGMKDEEAHLTIPSVIFVKDGETVYIHRGTVPGYDGFERNMTEEECDELYLTLRSAFEYILGQTDTIHKISESFSEETIEPTEESVDIEPQISASDENVDQDLDINPESTHAENEDAYQDAPEVEKPYSEYSEYSEYTEWVPEEYTENQTW